MNQVSSISFGPYGSLYFSVKRPTFLGFTHQLHFRTTSTRAVASHIVGLPRIGPKRELKFALESFWDGKSIAEELQKAAAGLRSGIWKQLADAGIQYIPSNTLSYYDQMLDTTAMLGAVPPRYGWKHSEIGFETYFSMARGNANFPAMEMTKWFDTNYHYIVPELGPHIRFSYASHKAVDEFKEAKALGVNTIPVLIGPVSYLLLSKPARGIEQSFSPLSLLRYILPVYKEVMAELKAASATWVQFDEPALVLDLDANQLEAFTHTYSELESSFSGLNVLIETYFSDVTAEAYKTITSLKGVTGYGFDLVRGAKTLDLIKGGFPTGKHLFAGVVDGRNIWANDLASSVNILQALESIVGKDKIVVSTSCSLLHTAVDLENETKLDKDIKPWLAFAAQKVIVVNASAKALSGQKDEAFFTANAAAQASRKSSPRVTNEAVQKAVAALKGSDKRRPTNVSTRLHYIQQRMGSNQEYGAETERCAVVSGANKGIGFEVVRQLASQGVVVVLTARDEKRGREATSKLQQLGLSNVVFHQLDVLNPVSIHSLAKFIHTRFGRLDILVNNAGASGALVSEKDLKSLDIDSTTWLSGKAVNQIQGTIKYTYEKAEECLNTNYYGVKRLTEALLPLLQLSTLGARIVNVSSLRSELKRIPSEEIRNELGDVEILTEEKVDAVLARFLHDFKQNKLEANGWTMMLPAYSISKATLNAYTRILANKYPNMCINCVHPGFVNTDLNWHTGTMTVEEGAAGLVRLALLPHGGPSGCYFDRTEVADF